MEVSVDQATLDKRKLVNPSVKMILTSKDCVFGLLTFFMGTINFMYWGGWLTANMQHDGFNPDYVGYVIGS